MSRRFPTQRIKKHRQYTYQDTAEVTGASVQTVRSWRGAGLAVMTGQKPHLILGEALIEFLERRRTRRTVKLAPDQVYCLSCRAARRPHGMMADYLPISASRGRLQVLCEVCDGLCQRFVSAASLNDLGRIFEIDTNKPPQA